MACDIPERNKATPDGIQSKPGLSTGLTWDIFDENTETLSGVGTLHDTVGICYQNVYLINQSKESAWDQDF